jgi:hypothetical protein
VARTRWLLAAIIYALFCAASVGAASEDAPSAADEELVKNVWKRLLSVAEPVPGLEWPPRCTIENEDAINAYATAEVEVVPISEDDQGKKGSVSVKFKLKVTPRVVVFRGMIEKIIHTKSDKDLDAAADRLAYVLGHELSHIVLLHIKPDRTKKTSLVRNVFGREQEIAADVKGAELALKAGFSMRRGQESIRRMKSLGLDYSSFEGLLADHPSWSDRLVHLDTEQAGLWKSMSAFENGTFFLLTEQFVSAEICFRQVTREFPKCHEAWTNLGYALLMQYCDGLDTEDLRRFKIGQLLIGGFYRRPKSLESETRGVQIKVWEDAVACLQQSLKLKEDQVLARANLGVAYLVHPDGAPDVTRATRYLREAATKVDSDEDLDPLTRAAILINAGVADLADQKLEESVRKFDLGEKMGGRSFGLLGRSSVNTGLSNALLYNRALLLASAPEKDKQRQALPQLEEYLNSSSPAGAWWPLAYERYAALCKKLEQTPKKKEALADPPITRQRLITSIQLASGINLALSEPLTDAAERLGERVPVVSRTKLARVRYPDHGIEVLATDRILAIHLKGEKSPPLQLRDSGLGGGMKELKLNMSESDFNALLGDELFESRPLDDLKVLYQFYPRLGLAVRFKDKKVADLAVAQIPRARPGE